jgi:predicted dehydrogenase
LAACDRGKAIFAGGDLAWSADDLLTVRDRVQKSGVAFLAEFPRRYAPATIRLMELIATRLGPPQLLFCHDQEREPVRPAERFGCQDAMPRSLVEAVDWSRYVVGSEPSSVVGVCHPGTNTPQHGSYRMLSLDFSQPAGTGQGPMAQISYGSYIPSAWTEAASFHAPSQLQVCCERGVAFLDLPSTLIWFDEAGRHIESLESERSPVEALLMRLHRAVTSLVQVTSDLEDACRAHEIVRQACRSAHSGNRVPL